MAPRKSASKKNQKKAAAPKKPVRRALHYKVVELNNVDEHSLERTINEWVPHGWKFDGVQFAMRESSKRPSMAFVFFTREGDELPEPVTFNGTDAFRSGDEADAHLRRLSVSTMVTLKAPGGDDVGGRSVTRGEDAPSQGNAWARLQALAGEDE